MKHFLLLRSNCVRMTSCSCMTICAIHSAVAICSAQDAIADPREDRISASEVSNTEFGNAWVDPANPIRKLFDGERLDLWSLQPLRPTLIPPKGDSDWPWNPIDLYLMQDWEKQGGAPSEDVSPREWLRRLSIDTIGIPPTFEESERFEQNADGGDIVEWVDHYLASPRYGEHWARMWLDAVRYSDSNGFDWDEFRPAAWRYRDYVIQAWNRDEPFDRFTISQLAGDELFDGKPIDEQQQQSLIATGYLRLGPYDNAAKLFNEQDRARAELLSDLTETTASAWLGLTMGCCRCHDHKTDPLSHQDHYRLRAFFAATAFADDLSIDLAEKQFALAQRNEELANEVARLEKEQYQWLARIAQDKGIEPPSVDESSSQSESNDDKRLKKKRKEFEKKVLDSLTDEQRSEWSAMEKRIASLQSGILKPTVGLVMTDNKQSIEPIAVFAQGDHRKPLEVVEPGFPSVLYPGRPTWTEPVSRSTTGRRLTLAKWIVARDNPWTARVIVNRLWANTFGMGIVATPNDFGMTGSRPSHPELLDYLATELIESGWSIKAVQRLILSSHAYRMSAIAVHHSPVDAKGRILQSVRRGLKRMTAEQLRDSMLSVSGNLQYRVGGPPVWPELSPEVLQANPAVLDDNETKTKGWYPSPASEQSVRSIFLIQKRTLRLPWMETFDQPENAVSCARRDTSIVAPQALTLMNGQWTERAAIDLASRIELEWIERPDRIEQLFRAVLSRNPTLEETTRCEQFMKRRTLAELALVLMNTNEFCFVP